MTNVQPGQMAKVVIGRNKGTIVEVRSQNKLLSLLAGELYWHVNLLQPAYVRVAGTQDRVWVDAGSTGNSAPDRVLRPIDDPDADAVPRETEEEIPA